MGETGSDYPLDEDREELEDLKTEVGRLNRELAGAKGSLRFFEDDQRRREMQRLPSAYGPLPKPSKAWAVLGLLTVMGLGFLLIFIGIPPFIAGIAAVFIGGFLARRAGAGALVGFLGVFLPLFLLGLLFLLMIPTSVEGLAGLGTILVGLVGIVLMIVGTIFGLIGAGIGIIAGLISSKVWKYRPLLKQMMSRV